jgi:hypothetical protein
VLAVPDGIGDSLRNLRQREAPVKSEAVAAEVPPGVLVKVEGVESAYVVDIGQADVLLTVKGNQKTQHRQIHCQFQGKRHIPFIATAQSKKAWPGHHMGDAGQGGSGSHQDELAWRERDHRVDHHHHDLQSP